MKIISKTYVLVSILILAAFINLTLLYQTEQTDNSQSYTIISTGDLKVQIESITGLATSVASGNNEDVEEIENTIKKIENILKILKNGGNINELTIEKIPSALTSEYNKVTTSWERYKEKAMDVENTSVFDMEATSAMNYVLQKNSELVLETNSLSKELSGLDRNYNKHKEIAKKLENSALAIGKLTLVISIGEEENVQEQLKNERVAFSIGLEKLLGTSTNETLDKIPRENSETLRKLDPLWEAIQPKIKIVEERALLSTEFIQIRNEMNAEKISLYSDIDNLLYLLNQEIIKENTQGQVAIQ
ncbi:MAG: two-component sensor histidine kinase, partial [Nitrosopumilales archaeon CG_4_10_14_0_8_um_filter_34_8]